MVARSTTAALSLAPAQSPPCALEGGLTLFHPETSADAASCWRPPFELVKSTAVAFVVTWSAGSSGAASGKNELSAANPDPDPNSDPDPNPDPHPKP